MHNDNSKESTGKELDRDSHKKENEILENIKEIGQIKTPQPKSNIHCITIIGQIEGHILLPPQNKATKYEHIIPQIVAIDDSNDIEGLLLILNTMGGDVEAGLALSELISSIEKPSVSLVLGGGHSIGVPLAVSTDYSFIAPTATMTIHPIRMNGLIIGVPQMFDYFNKMQQRITNFVISHSNISEGDFNKLMFSTSELANDVGSILVGKEAVEYGLIDKTGGLKDAMVKLHELIEHRKHR